jgi:ABC-2 type transport system ATP-binding protein
MNKDEMPVVVVKNLFKTFKLPHEQASGVKQIIVNFASRKKGYEKQKVLKDVSFEIKKGEFFGIVGRNGSGKSTLLKLLAGIYAPDEGLVQVNGSLTPFIELGVGFNPELTGRENIFLNGALLGFSRSEMNEMYDDIVDFAELEKFLDQKLKNYSSGMQVRLAFSIAIRAQSDILLLDEVLAVGDADFQRKCYDYFMSLKSRKQTVILVTHDMNAVRQYCDRAIMIESGEIVKQGTPEEVAQEYQKLFATNNDEDTHPRENEDSWGEGGITVEKTSVSLTDKFLQVTTTYKATKDLPAPVYGFTLHNKAGINVLEANTIKEKIKTAPVLRGENVVIEWKIPNILSDGSYNLSVACCDQSVTRFYTWLNNAATFKVDKYKNTAGVVNPEIEAVIKEKK